MSGFLGISQINLAQKSNQAGQQPPIAQASTSFVKNTFGSSSANPTQPESRSMFSANELGSDNIKGANLYLLA